LIVGDIILRVNTTPVGSLDQTSQALAAVESGRSARLVVWRIERDRQGQEIGHQILVNVRKR
jgi:S1-C subfamily serine protease